MNTLREVGGGFGDVGLLLPLAVALIVVNGMSATAVLVLAGLLYIVSGSVFRVPVPVQPLKAVSAIAIAQHLGGPEIAAAGILVGATFTVLGLTGLADRLSPVFVTPVVRGVQVGIGLLLARSALDLAAAGVLPDHRGPGLAGTAAALTVALLVGLGAWRGVPGLPLLALGTGVGVSLLAGSHLGPAGLGPAGVHLVLPGSGAMLAALFTLAIPQIGLSLGNSLYATSSAATAYFGDRGGRATPGRLALSMGLANLVAAPLGGLPMCHGAGGMTAHYRLGARTGRATIVFGSVLVLSGLWLGRSAEAVFVLVPAFILAGLLVYVGMQHCLLARDQRSWTDRAVVLVVAAVAVVTSNLTLGLVLGLVVAWGHRLLVEQRRNQASGLLE
ncbi:MAG: putative sulfate/molybdate transporter [Candidatus Dormibacteria bacterium]